MGIWGGVSVTGLLLPEQAGDEIALAIETGVLLAGIWRHRLLASVAIAWRGETVCVAEFLRILALTRCHDPTSHEVGYGADRRFAFALTPLVAASLLLACYAPRRLVTWWRANKVQRWELLGWHASLDDDGHITRLISAGETAIANLEALAPEASPHLKYLELYDEGQSDGLPELLPLPKLETLIVHGASDANLSNLERFPNLESLTVPGTRSRMRDSIV